MAKQQIAIVGIGTDVGKTVVSAIITESLQADYWKPIQAGLPKDSDTVKSLLANTESEILPEKYMLNEAMSPHAAAEIDKIQISLSDLALPQTDKDLVVELAGGLMVPLNNEALNIDLLEKWNIPVVLVINYYLGSINHTLLSIELLSQRGINVIGLVFNGEEVLSTRQIIESKTIAPTLLKLNKEELIDISTIKGYANQLNLKRTLQNG